MRQGYKYYPNPRSKEWITVPVDHEIAGFEQTMDYSDVSSETPDSFIQAHCSGTLVRQLHDAFTTVCQKENLTIGIGSGYGEHELLLHREGYNIIASDIIPGLTEKTAGLFPGFRGYTLDIFQDELQTIPEAAAGKNRPVDILVSGLDFYFDDTRTLQLFRILHTQMEAGAALIFTIRYPDSLSRRLIEFWLYSEAWINYHIRRQGVIQKEHGYRRSLHDIRTMAEKTGFSLEAVQPVGPGCECSRSRILMAVMPLCRAIDAGVPLFHCAYVMKFRKIS